MSKPGESGRGGTPPPGSVSVPSISLSKPPSSPSLQPEAGDSGDYDDGPEYLAIGNLGQRSRSDSPNSTDSSEQGVAPALAPPPHRRSSFSAGQRGPGRAPRGHTRSFSDTGVSQKMKNGEKNELV